MTETTLETAFDDAGVSGIHIKRKTGNPVTVAPFDGDTQLDEYTSRLQLAAVEAFANGYYFGKEKYENNGISRMPVASSHPIWFAEGFAEAKAKFSDNES